MPMIADGTLSRDAAIAMRSAAVRSERVPGLYWPYVVSVMLADHLQMPSHLAWHVQRYTREIDYLRAVQWTRRIIREHLMHDDDHAKQLGEPIPLAPSEHDETVNRVRLRWQGRVIVDAEPFTREYWRQLAVHCAGLATDMPTRNLSAVPSLYLSYAAGVGLWAAGLGHGHIARALPQDRSRCQFHYTCERRDSPQPLAPTFAPMARGQVSRAVRSTADTLASLGEIYVADAA